MLTYILIYCSNSLSILQENHKDLTISQDTCDSEDISKESKSNQALNTNLYEEINNISNKLHELINQPINTKKISQINNKLEQIDCSVELTPVEQQIVKRFMITLKNNPSILTKIEKVIKEYEPTESISDLSSNESSDIEDKQDPQKIQARINQAQKNRLEKLEEFFKPLPNTTINILFLNT